MRIKGLSRRRRERERQVYCDFSNVYINLCVKCLNYDNISLHFVQNHSKVTEDVDSGLDCPV